MTAGVAVALAGAVVGGGASRPAQAADATFGALPVVPFFSEVRSVAATDGAVWINDSLALREFTTSGDPRQVAAVTVGADDNFSGLAFDAAGRIWTADQSQHTVIAFPASSSGSLTAASATGRISGFVDPVAVASDEAGDLWVADEGAGMDAVFEFPAAKVAGGILSLADASMRIAFGTELPTALAVGGDGTLWVAAGSG
ncbi:MAG: hypothetical protein LBM66_04420, partial [Bifidobacteriaceae bacterium]|nr:hypothetical protein [Bifidobacteriaceae bacterium]